MAPESINMHCGLRLCGTSWWTC